MLSDRIEEFLLIGSNLSKDSPENQRCSLAKEIRLASESFASEWETEQQKQVELRKKLEAVGAKVSKLRLVYEDMRLIDKLKKYLETQNRIQLLILAQTIQKLSKYDQIKEIPDLVLGVLKNVPKFIPPSSRIKILLVETVKRLRSDLIQKFHKKFEDHLNESLAENNAKESWMSFLADARDWLLAYATVSLLPVTLSESKYILLEKYQEVLDEMLTPLWSRFHFHLLDARETSSFDQLLWTFGYSKSFVQMLVNLCQQITSTGKLQQLQAGDYKLAGTQHVVEKAVKFMRAHFAQAIVKYSPLQATTCIQLVENSLEVDHFFKSIVSQPLTISSIIHDARPMHAQWIELELSYFRTALQEAFTGDIFSTAFGKLTLRVDDDSVGGSDSSSRSKLLPIASAKSTASFCYLGVYNCMKLFLVASQRYVYLSAAAQEQLCDLILEPLLNICVGLFILRIRSNRTLHAISNGSLPLGFDWAFSALSPSTAAAGIPKETECVDSTDRLPGRDEEIPVVVWELLEAADYCCQALGVSANGKLRIRPELSHRWPRLQSWLPKRLIASHEIAVGGSYSPVKLVERALAMPQSQQGLDESSAQAAYGSLEDTSRKKVVGRKEEEHKLTSLTDLIDIAQRRLVAVVSVVERQWRKLHNRRRAGARP